MIQHCTLAALANVAIFIRSLIQIMRIKLSFKISILLLQLARSCSPTMLGILLVYTHAPNVSAQYSPLSLRTNSLQCTARVRERITSGLSLIIQCSRQCHPSQGLSKMRLWARYVLPATINCQRRLEGGVLKGGIRKRETRNGKRFNLMHTCLELVKKKALMCHGDRRE